MRQNIIDNRSHRKAWWPMATKSNFFQKTSPTRKRVGSDDFPVNADPRHIVNITRTLFMKSLAPLILRDWRNLSSPCRIPSSALGNESPLDQGLSAKPPNYSVFMSLDVLVPFISSYMKSKLISRLSAFCELS